MISFIAWTVVFYLWHMLGVTIGLHRLLSHRAFRCPKVVEYFWVFGAYLAFHGSPVWWATNHRAHHRHVDTALDPHAPVNGLWDAYTFYKGFKYLPHIDPTKQSQDLLKDPIYRFLESGGNWKTGYALNVGLCLVFRLWIGMTFGWTIAAASLVGGIIALNVPLILNVVCHIPRLGYKNHVLADDSVNVPWMGYLALGEGWHNNHHAAPGSARLGMTGKEPDFAWFVMKGLRNAGMITAVNETITDLAAKLPAVNTAASTAIQDAVSEPVNEPVKEPARV